MFAAVAAGGAVASIRYARKSLQAAERAVTETEGSRLAAERERKRERLIRIGERVEKIAPFAWRQGPSPGDQFPVEWASGTTLLRQALVGFGEDELPRCYRLASEVGRKIDEQSTAGQAHNEVRDALAALDRE